MGERLKIKATEHGKRNEGDMKDLTAELVKLIHRAEARGLTCYQLAKKSGVSRAQLSNLMSGKRGVSVDTLVTLADALGYEVCFRRRGRKGS